MLRFLAYLSMLGALGLIVLGAGVGFLLWRMTADLPSHEHLSNYQPAVLSRVYAADGTLAAEYARQRRIFVPIETIPPDLIHAFLSAEDKKFFQHSGIDPRSIFRALAVNVLNVARGRRPIGGSTITQQVARNFLLSHRVSLERKIKEALLALRLERVLTKEQILELYLNQIYMGQGTYGVAAAALSYFGKSLPELTLAETAYLAALPKGPNNYHPVRNRQRATTRRNWVLGRMVRNNYITPDQAAQARAQDLIASSAAPRATLHAEYFVEEVRRRTQDLYGRKTLYEGGLSIRTTLDPRLQDLAHASLRRGLSAYDRRHGWRGAIRKIKAGAYWPAALARMSPPPDFTPWRLAVVLSLNEAGARIGLRPPPAPPSPESAASLAPPENGFIPLAELKWARAVRADGTLAPPVKIPADVLEVGHVVYVESLAKPVETGLPQYALRQIPRVNGALVAMNPHSGQVLALSGGFSFPLSQFNRATQAWRQPGSAFKPFVYASALDHGFTPASILLDVPFAAPRAESNLLWKPENYGRSFHGRGTLRSALEKSRNLMTVHLAQAVGLPPIIEYAKRFGLVEDVRPELGIALGQEETTLLRLTAAYAALVNGGRRVEPTLVSRIQDRRGRTLFRQDRRRCWQCDADIYAGQPPPGLPDTRDRIVSAQTAYQIVSMLEGVVRRGTGRAAATGERPIAGKTGTTNGERDAWFVGFAPDLVTGVFVGFDEPETLGRGETGGRAAAPIFADFMRRALAAQPAQPFRVPTGIALRRINLETGRQVESESPGAIWEAFKTGDGPDSETELSDSGEAAETPPPEEDFGAKEIPGTGGLY